MRSVEERREAHRLANQRWRERNPRVPVPLTEEQKAIKNAKARRSRAGRHREYRLRHTYRMEPEDYDRRLAEQGGVCAICKKPPPNDEHLQVDHDGTCCDTRRGKTCGQCIRGLLCRSCNTALHILDDPEKRAAALAYLGLTASQGSL